MDASNSDLDICICGHNRIQHDFENPDAQGEHPGFCYCCKCWKFERLDDINQRPTWSE